MTEWVHRFGAGRGDVDGADSQLLGGKGANLSRMAGLGIPVPPGFTVTTEVCGHFERHDGGYPSEVDGQVRDAMTALGAAMEAGFGDPERPLLVSVRSGAPVSMPGMMDTVLNLGLNDQTVEGLARQTGDPRFAWDCYRRFIAMYSEVVMGVKAESEHDESPFARLLDEAKRRAGVVEDHELDEKALRQLVTDAKRAIVDATGSEIPSDPTEQLWGAIGAVFRSWNGRRARVYRRLHGIDDSMGTAVNVQAMVYGNMGPDSATGVAFTRNPASGDNRLYGEFLINAQGEDVVAGVRTPQPIDELARLMPDVHAELSSIADRLEDHFADMQDLEFTVQHGKLWLLQTRTGKRTGRAMVEIAASLVAAGKIDTREAVLRMDPDKLDELMHPTIDPANKPDAAGQGLPASPGAAVGEIVFTADEAEALGARGKKVILMRTDTSPEDIHGMQAAVGILTARGGMTSHAAVVARGMGIPCVAGCSDLAIDAANQRARIGSVELTAGTVITIDGSTGEVFPCAAELRPAEIGGAFDSIMAWADEHRRLQVRANADNAADARTALRFGAAGIGLCRTEHMFFEPERILAVREMILADDEDRRRAALAKILPMQRSDFLELFRVMDGKSVTIRLLDPPLHEFLPTQAEEIEEVARDLGVTPEAVARSIEEHREANPMLGHRGCRLAISYPEICETQVRAIAEAAVAAASEGVSVRPEIMVPLVADPGELRILRPIIERVFGEVVGAAGTEIPYLVGTMMELPRACLLADEIAEEAEFFSFGTNDLTQTTFGLSRDDAERFLGDYIKRDVLARDPFVALDQRGVGKLVTRAVADGREIKPGLKVGICGEHGGEPASVEFCHRAGLDYVSCSPFRLPVARVAAARAALLDDE